MADRGYSFCHTHLVHNCRRCDPAADRDSLVEDLSASVRQSVSISGASGRGESNMAVANYEDLRNAPVLRSESVEPTPSSEVDRQHGGARPRSGVTIRRSHTSPDTLINRAVLRPITADPGAAAEDADCRCKGPAKKGPSVRKSLDAFLKSTRRRLQAKSKRTQPTTVVDEQRQCDTSVAPPTACAREITPPASAAVSHPPGLPPSVEMLDCLSQRADVLEEEQVPQIRAHTTVDYLHYLVPGLTDITNCGFYWGIMDRYKAEALLENKPEGTFLLRDSSQDDFIFSVSFRRYGRSLHARVEQCNHRFSFDAIDSGVFKASSVTALLEHYKDPQTCMFFEPMLTLPLNRPQPFSLLHLARSAVCDSITYDSIDKLRIPTDLHRYLKYYHYKQKIRVRTDAGWVNVKLPNGHTYSWRLT